jgi:hypothetical protein
MEEVEYIDLNGSLAYTIEQLLVELPEALNVRVLTSNSREARLLRGVVHATMIYIEVAHPLTYEMMLRTINVPAPTWETDEVRIQPGVAITRADPNDDPFFSYFGSRELPSSLFTPEPPTFVDNYYEHRERLENFTLMIPEEDLHTDHWIMDDEDFHLDQDEMEARSVSTWYSDDRMPPNAAYRFNGRDWTEEEFQVHRDRIARRFDRHFDPEPDIDFNPFWRLAFSTRITRVRHPPIDDLRSFWALLDRPARRQPFEEVDLRDFWTLVDPSYDEEGYEIRLFQQQVDGAIAVVTNLFNTTQHNIEEGVDELRTYIMNGYNEFNSGMPGYLVDAGIGEPYHHLILADADDGVRQVMFVDIVYHRDAYTQYDHALRLAQEYCRESPRLHNYTIATLYGLGTIADIALFGGAYFVTSQALLMGTSLATGVYAWYYRNQQDRGLIRPSPLGNIHHLALESQPGDYHSNPLLVANRSLSVLQGVGMNATYRAPVYMDVVDYIVRRRLTDRHSQTLMGMCISDASYRCSANERYPNLYAVACSGIYAYQSIFTMADVAVRSTVPGM